MTYIDQFESVFKSADKVPFQPETVSIRSVLTITSLPAGESEIVETAARRLLESVESREALNWQAIHGDQFHDVDRLLALTSEIQPDLICTYRNLHAPAPDHPYSLGSYVDVLAQTTEVPVMLLPTPAKLAARPEPLTPCRSVMAVTDHLTGDHHLISNAACLTHATGTLLLTHIEDELTFERYMGVISKTPEIDTETARAAILEQLLKEPHDFILSARQVLQEKFPALGVEEIVILGHRLTDYRRLIEQHKVDLLVMNTKDEDQLAMHGLAYPLAVELRDTPILLL